jgi:hypothetical protein
LVPSIAIFLMFWAAAAGRHGQATAMRPRKRAYRWPAVGPLDMLVHLFDVGTPIDPSADITRIEGWLYAGGGDLLLDRGRMFAPFAAQQPGGKELRPKAGDVLGGRNFSFRSMLSFQQRNRADWQLLESRSA